MIAFDLFQAFIQLTATDQLHDDDDRLSVLIELVELDDVLVLQPFADLELVLSAELAVSGVELR